MIIRRAASSDSAKISKLILNTLNKVNSKDYAKRQLDIEKKNHSISEIKKELKKKIFFVLLDKEQIVGVVQLDLKEKAIDRLFLNQKYLKKGLGKKLLSHAEDYAIKKGAKKILLYPTDYALKFYKKMGYKVIREFIGTRNGGYPVIEMQKMLKK